MSWYNLSLSREEDLKSSFFIAILALIDFSSYSIIVLRGQQMDTYQIGNKLTCIVRAFTAGTIGNVTMTYDNEPYTILRDVSASLIFADKEKNAREGIRRELNFDMSVLNQVKITNVHLTDRILHMIFQKQKDALKSFSENVESDENGKIYLNTSEETIYQVFIFGEDLTLAQAYGEVNPEDILVDSDKSYLVIYQTLASEAVNLDSPENTYFTLDLICEGNTNEETAPTYIHIEKAGVRVDKNMYFNRNLNAVDLTFNVIHTAKDYIVLK